MIRRSFKPKAPQREQRDRSDEFASVVMQRPTNARMATAKDIATFADQMARPAPKLPRAARTVQAIRDSARGESCSIRITGACNNNPATTVWCHLPGIDGDRGMGLKALDHCGAYGCASCHDVLDGRAPLPAGATRQSVMLDFFFGHMRSLVRLAQKGLL